MLLSHANSDLPLMHCNLSGKIEASFLQGELARHEAVAEAKIEESRRAEVDENLYRDPAFLAAQDCSRTPLQFRQVISPS